LQTFVAASYAIAALTGWCFDRFRGDLTARRAFVAGYAPSNHPFPLATDRAWSRAERHARSHYRQYWRERQMRL